MEESQKMSLFHECGIYLFDDSKAIFIDPVRVLNLSYNRFKVSPSTYYPRFFEPQCPNTVSTVTSSPTKRKRKRKQKQSVKEPQPLNERERIANQRHQEVRPLLLNAHECLLKCTELLDALSTLRNDSGCSKRECHYVQHSFIELAQEAPLLETTLDLCLCDPDSDPGQLPCNFEDSLSGQCCEQRVLPAFNNLVANDTEDDAVAGILNSYYIMPRESCFYMSDLGQIRNLIPAHADSGFNLIVVDPPWENASAHQKLREKLRSFVEQELFPAWGVSYAANFYWLKVKANGSLVCDLDLFHHRPYESLILGYSPGKVNNSDNQSKFKPVKDHVIMSIPGDYSRKPPIADLLLEYVPGIKPPRCIELFAREMIAGWVAWGNEPLHFQDSRYFVKR